MPQCTNSPILAIFSERFKEVRNHSSHVTLKTGAVEPRIKHSFFFYINFTAQHEAGARPLNCTAAAANPRLPHPPATRDTASSSSFSSGKGALSTERPTCWSPPHPETQRPGAGAGGRRRWGATGAEGPRRPATRACADPSTRPFTYRWNRDAPFPGRGRFSRTRGDGKRARTEAPTGSAAGKPLPGAAADERLKLRLRRGASPQVAVKCFVQTKLQRLLPNRWKQSVWTKESFFLMDLLNTDIFDCHHWRGAIGWWVKVKDAGKHPLWHRTAPTAKNSNSVCYRDERIPH
ncbi:uncharacterized protein [Symphalangus syndactylus]|uniref:uncharacterized protein n=1 Tax=Symphalangus syndactylus TaxID=9590 RepID=UPI003005A6FD